MNKIDLERIFWVECDKFSYDAIAIKSNYSLIVAAFFTDGICFTHYDINFLC